MRLQMLFLNLPKTPKKQIQGMSILPENGNEGVVNTVAVEDIQMVPRTFRGKVV